MSAFTRGETHLSMIETEETRGLESQRIRVERVIGLGSEYTRVQDTHSYYAAKRCLRFHLPLQMNTSCMCSYKYVCHFE